MSITPFSLDVNTPLAHSRPVEKRDSGGGHLNLAAVTRGHGTEEEKIEKKEEVHREQDTKPALHVLQQPGLEFSLDKDTGLIVVKMYDRESGDLIRQLPPEETLAFLRQVAKNKKGVLVSKQL